MLQCQIRRRKRQHDMFDLKWLTLHDLRCVQIFQDTSANTSFETCEVMRVLTKGAITPEMFHII